MTINSDIRLSVLPIAQKENREFAGYFVGFLTSIYLIILENSGGYKGEGDDAWSAPSVSSAWTLERVKQGLVCATCVITLAITPTLDSDMPLASFHSGILCVVLDRRRKGCNSLLARNREGRGAGDYSLEVDSPVMINAGPQIRSSVLPFESLPFYLDFSYFLHLRLRFRLPPSLARLSTRKSKGNIGVLITDLKARSKITSSLTLLARPFTLLRVSFDVSR